jgi:hypothetical protein
MVSSAAESGRKRADTKRKEAQDVLRVRPTGMRALIKIVDFVLTILLGAYYTPLSGRAG